MLKWIKVRQDASATPTPLDREKKDEVVAKVEVEGATREEEEDDSGMEREDTPSNIELNDLRKVMLHLLIRFNASANYLSVCCCKIFPFQSLIGC